MTLHPGAEAVVYHEVADTDTARALGSGDLDVLGTPRLLAWCEHATLEAVKGHLGDTATTVGSRVELSHSRACGVGTSVTVWAHLVHVDGRLLRFDVAATDADGQVLAHGHVTRVLVDRDRFLERL